MAIVGTATEKPVAFTLALGVMGGALLIIVEWTTTRGPLIFFPYAAIVLMTAVYLRVEKVQPFLRRFLMALGSFMFASMLLYVFIGVALAKTALTISLAGHAWRIGLLLAIGAVLSAAVAQLTGTRPLTSHDA